ncbi:PP2C family protein-serine/threonine phosphatase [Streptomyces sp. NPDC092296]|uniref:PP2C family protein-serine/threonine phosphatase n=1 Tax=Streptomyces sp. NPDC092296 TaxID=3366012 RepID=UPI0037F3BB82
MDLDRLLPEGWPRWRRLLPALLITAAVLIDLASPSRVSTVPLLAASPVAAAPLLSCPGTITTGLVASLVGLGLARWHSRVVDTATFIELLSVVMVTVFAAAINRLIARDRQRLRSARDVAEAVQRAVLPPPPARIGPLSVAARYTAADAEAAIGGDLYAVQETPFGVRLIMSDVRGKGIGAVEVVTVLLGAFREAADRMPALADVVREIERALLRVTRLREGLYTSEGFATAIIAEVSGDGQVIDIANRGHPAPLMVYRGHVEALEPAEPSLPLGLGEFGDGGVPVDRFELLPGAAVILYTDGVTEARDRNGVFYDPVPRLSRPVPSDPDGLLDAVLADLATHAGVRLADDVAMVAVVRSRDVPA